MKEQGQQRRDLQKEVKETEYDIKERYHSAKNQRLSREHPGSDALVAATWDEGSAASDMKWLEALRNLGMPNAFLVDAYKESRRIIDNGGATRTETDVQSSQDDLTVLLDQGDLNEEINARAQEKHAMGETARKELTDSITELNSLGLTKYEEQTIERALTARRRYDEANTDLMWLNASFHHPYTSREMITEIFDSKEEDRAKRDNFFFVKSNGPEENQQH